MPRMGNKIYFYDDIDSTQLQALSILKKEQENAKNIIIMARTQSAGKGRMERKWQSPLGGLWLSIILKPDISASLLTFFPLAIGISICETIKEITGIKPKLKWPNDVLINNKKVAGTIIDAGIEKDKIDYIIVGIGINLNFSTKDILIKQNKENHNNNFIEPFPITTIKDENNHHEVDSNKFTGKLLDTFETLTWNIKNNYHKVINSYSGLSDTIGKKIMYFNSRENGIGTAYKIDDDGSLIIKLENEKFLKITTDTSIRYFY